MGPYAIQATSVRGGSARGGTLFFVRVARGRLENDVIQFHFHSIPDPEKRSHEHFQCLP